MVGNQRVAKHRISFDSHKYAPAFGFFDMGIWGGAQNLVFCTQSELTLCWNCDMLSKGQQEMGNKSIWLTRLK